MQMPAKTLLLATLMTLTSMSPAFAQGLDPFKIRHVSEHKLLLLNNGLASLEERLQMMERAQKSIDIEYFIYRTDKSAKLFTEVLLKKARQGVKVRMLLDYFMVKSDLSPFYAHELEKAGVEVKYFNTTSSLNAFSGQYRNHRKVLIVDGVEAITGGRNIGDEYFDLSHEYNFLDRDVHLTGAAVNDMQITFDKVFSSDKSERVARDEKPDLNDGKYMRDSGQDEHAYRYDLQRWEEKVAAAKKFVSGTDAKQTDLIRSKGLEILGSEYRTSCSSLVYQSEYPDANKENRKKNRILKHDLFGRIENATSSVIIDSPYFIVNDELKKSLETALSKKVPVTVLTNSLNSTDAIYVYTVFDTIIKKWIHKGLETHIFKGNRPKDYQVIPEMSGEARFGVHAKTFVFDDKDVVIGTFNVDPRSANFNVEMTITCENNKDFAAKVKEDIQSRINESLHLDSDEDVNKAEFYQVGFTKKVLYYLLKIPSNLFDYLL